MKLMKIAGCVLFAGMILAGCKPAPNQQQAESKPDAGHPALRVETLDGATFDLAAQRGNWVLVNYWATWCGPCIKEMPELSALAAMREHIRIIGLAYDEASPDELRDFLKTHPVTYPIARIDVYEPPQDFGAPRGLPTSWLIAPDGHLARKYTGPLTASMLEADIAALSP